MNVPKVRITLENAAEFGDGAYVLYWMTAFRRPSSNFALDRAIEVAKEMKKGLVVLEALRNGYRWASDRHHTFVMQGMADNLEAFAGTSVAYLPFVEESENAGRGLLEVLAADACLVVTDDFPAFMLPKMTRAAADKIGVRMEKVDSNGIYPMRETSRAFSRAHDFRRHLHKSLRPHLEHFPNAQPLVGLDLPHVELPDLKAWNMATRDDLVGGELLKRLPIDHGVTVVSDVGGHVAARARLSAWIQDGLSRYGVDRNHPDTDASSRLSFWLHFGHLSAHEVFTAVIEGTEWSPADIALKATGSRDGWWGLPPSIESFLDELITWREVGFNMCSARPDDYDRYESLPGWAQLTLEEHEADPRENLYTFEEFEQAKTHDPIWNAAQRQLVSEGRIHNYLRMLWGKKILHWTTNPRQALDIMVELNNKYAVDGRDPCSYSGIFWVLGRYDRAWGPEREVFGKIRYMTSASTAKKLKMKRYMEIHGEDGQSGLF